MTFRISWIGLIFLLGTIGPNLIWTRNKPEDYEKYVGRESNMLRALERTGETMVTCTALIFASGQPLLPLTLRSLWLAGAVALMVMYELFWLRYFRSSKTMADFYSSFLAVPVAGAVLPVAAFALLAVYDRNLLLGISVLVLGIGHIGIHLQHAREVARGIDPEE